MSKWIENDIMVLKNVLLTHLPDNFKTEYTLDCSDSEITFLPNGLEVGRDLLLGNSYIEELPSNLIVGGNIYLSERIKTIPEDAIIGGVVIYPDGKIQTPNLPKNHFIKTEDGYTIIYKHTRIVIHENDLPNDFYYPEIIFYQNINKEDSIHGTSFTENGETYYLSCSSKKDAIYQVALKKAQLNGIDKYKDYDIDELRTVDELIEIFKVCTCSCESGIQKFLEYFKIDKTKKYSLRETRSLVLKTPFSVTAKRVFVEFFDPLKRENKEAK